MPVDWSAIADQTQMGRIMTAYERYGQFGDDAFRGDNITLKNADKWLEEAGVFDGKISTADTGIAFKSVMSNDEKTMNFANFKDFLGRIAESHNAKDPNAVLKSMVAKLQSHSHPGTHDTTKVDQLNVVERLTDPSKYTGTQRFSASGKALEGQDLPDQKQVKNDGYVAGYKNADTYDQDHSSATNVDKSSEASSARSPHSSPHRSTGYDKESRRESTDRERSDKNSHSPNSRRTTVQGITESRTQNRLQESLNNSGNRSDAEKAKSTDNNFKTPTNVDRNVNSLPESEQKRIQAGGLDQQLQNLDINKDQAQRSTAAAKDSSQYRQNNMNLNSNYNNGQSQRYNEAGQNEPSTLRQNNSNQSFESANDKIQRQNVAGVKDPSALRQNYQDIDQQKDSFPAPRQDAQSTAHQQIANPGQRLTQQEENRRNDQPIERTHQHSQVGSVSTDTDSANVHGKNYDISAASRTTSDSKNPKSSMYEAEVNAEWKSKSPNSADRDTSYNKDQSDTRQAQFKDNQYNKEKTPASFQYANSHPREADQYHHQQAAQSGKNAATDGAAARAQPAYNSDSARKSTDAKNANETVRVNVDHKSESGADKTAVDVNVQRKTNTGERSNQADGTSYQEKTEMTEKSAGERQNNANNLRVNVDGDHQFKYM